MIELRVSGNRQLTPQEAACLLEALAGRATPVRLLRRATVALDQLTHGERLQYDPSWSADDKDLP